MSRKNWYHREEYPTNVPIPERVLKKQYLIIGSAILFILGGLVGGGITHFSISQADSNAYPLRIIDEKYDFIEPLIGIEVGDKKEFDEFYSLEKSISSAIERLIRDGRAQSISVYFRDLESGRWTGVNEDEKYSPASLYKVALMIAHLKNAENDPSKLERTIIFPGSRSKEKPDYPPMEIGKSYTVKELIKRLVIYSDNDAKDLLHELINQDSVNDVFSDLGLHVPTLDETGDSMSAKDYSRFFRTLFSATYLNRPMSELALEMLAQAEFKDGIAAGPAVALPVAHKFGYRTYSKPVNGVTKQLHDCGIIYYPEHPYFLCVMTKGSDNTNLVYTLQNISRMVYRQVDTLSKH